MDEPTTPVAPTFFEKIKANRKVILTRTAIIAGTALGILAAAALLKKIESDEEALPETLVLYEVVDDETDESTAA